nr:MAG TPA: hypothetical protein [Caudoviricetes sp.]
MWAHSHVVSADYAWFRRSWRDVACTCRIPAVLIRLLSWMAVFLGFPMAPRLFVNSGNSL